MSEKTDKPNAPAMMAKKRSVRKEIKVTDKYIVNKSFRSKFKRLQVNALQKKEGRKESDAIHSKVLQDRKHYIDAAIVKTMKTRQQLKHNQLIDEVIRLNRFPCEIDDICQRIKLLTEQEYMRPDEKDPKLYFYIA